MKNFVDKVTFKQFNLYFDCITNFPAVKGVHSDVEQIQTNMNLRSNLIKIKISDFIKKFILKSIILILIKLFRLASELGQHNNDFLFIELTLNFIFSNQYLITIHTLLIIIVYHILFNSNILLIKLNGNINQM